MADIDTGPWKGKAPALLSYEKLTEISNTLVALSTMMNNFASQAASLAKKDEDLEYRIRVLEVAIGRQEASSATAKDTREGIRWLTGTLIALGGVAMGAMSVYIALSRAVH